MMGIKSKKSALKSVVRGTVSPQQAFVGQHPDKGTMRIMVQVGGCGWRGGGIARGDRGFTTAVHVVWEGRYAGR